MDTFTKMEIPGWLRTALEAYQARSSAANPADDASGQGSGRWKQT